MDYANVIGWLIVFGWYGLLIFGKEY